MQPTNNKDVHTVAEALTLGLSVACRARNGDRVTIKTTRVYRSKRKKSPTSEYSLTQSLMATAYTSNDATEIAKMALDHAGQSVVIEAQRLVNSFLSAKTGDIN